MITLLAILYTIVWIILLFTLHSKLTLSEKITVALAWPLILIIIGISYTCFKLTGKKVEL